jgi:serine/threonine protein kinase
MAKYRDIQELGRGGFGVVHKCARMPDGALFAKKALLLDDTGSIKRFQREVRIIQKLDHRGIVRIVETHLASPPYWYIMPLYECSVLELIPNLLTDRDRALRIFDSVLEAVEYAHGEQVIHRDIKPENVLMGPDDSCVVTDFGLGRALDALTSRATGTGAWIGTIGCMAPEQMTEAGNADGRSDIFSLGRMLYEILAAEPRWAVQDPTKLPVGLAEIVRKCTLTDPNHRFQNVAEVRAALARVTQRQMGAGQSLQALVDKIRNQASFTLADIQELAKLIGLCREESDLLHEVAVKISAFLFNTLDTGFPDISKLLAQQFAKTAISQNWSFGYTDTIGDTCSKIYGATSQPDVKGLMAATALEVGVSHNRFHVMDVAANLIAGSKSEGEALAIAHAISLLNYRAVEDRLTIWKLHPALQELFADTMSN